MTWQCRYGSGTPSIRRFSISTWAPGVKCMLAGAPSTGLEVTLTRIRAGRLLTSAVETQAITLIFQWVWPAAPNGNTYGSSSLINFGTNSNWTGQVNALGPYQFLQSGNSRQPCPSQNADTFILGNLTAPFVSSQCGLITPDEFNSPSTTFEAQPMSVGSTFDNSSPVTHAYVGCNVGTSVTVVYCNPYRFNDTGIWIGKDNALVPGKYLVTVSAKDVTTATNTFTMGFGATCLTAVQIPVSIKNTWPQARSDYFQTILDLSAASGNCAVAFQILGATTADQIQIGFVAYTPLPEQFSANTINLLNAFLLNGNPGSAGNALQSGGPGAPPTWQLNPGLLNFPSAVSATTPLFLEAHFRQDMQAMFFSYSTDGANYVQLNGSYATSGGFASGMRDIGALLSGSTFYFAYTGPNNGQFNYITSADLQNFSAPTTVTVTGAASSGAVTWSPRFFSDPVSGNTYAIVGACTSSCSETQLPFIAQFNTSTNTFGTWSPVTVSGESGQSGLLDFRLYYSAANTTYYLIYAYAAGGNEYLHIASASAVGGPYTRIHVTIDYFGFGNEAENPDIVLLPNGNVRVYADTFIDPTNSAPFWYTRKWVDTQNSFGTVVGTPAQVAGPEQEGGTNITITTPAALALVYSAARAQPSPVNQVMGNLGVNGAPNAEYSVFLANLGSSGFPNGINPNPYTSVGFGNASGAPSVISSVSAGNFFFGTFPGDRLANIFAGAADFRGVNSAGGAGSHGIDGYRAQAFVNNAAGIDLDDTAKGGKDYIWQSYTDGDLSLLIPVQTLRR